MARHDDRDEGRGVALSAAECLSEDILRDRSGL
jgi:hypothetical protein